MKASIGIHFRGSGAVIQAYKNQEIPNWAIFQGNQFLFCDDKKKLTMQEGEATLKNVLTMLDKSEDVFTIRVYKNFEGAITNATKYNGSFNFLLGEHARTDTYADYRRGTNDRLEAIEKMLLQVVPEETDNPDAQPKEISGINAVIGKILENPTMQQYIAQKIITLVEKIIPTAAGTPAEVVPFEQAAKVAGVNDGPDQLAMINQAIDIMYPVDPKLGEHLMKLATIARDSPDKFRSLITMLNTF